MEMEVILSLLLNEEGEKDIELGDLERHYNFGYCRHIMRRLRLLFVGFTGGEQPGQMRLRLKEHIHCRCGMADWVV